jgi:hypothetical protein
VAQYGDWDNKRSAGDEYSDYLRWKDDSNLNRHKNGWIIKTFVL